MQAIKALVITMSVLLVAGLALLGYGMYSKARKLSAPAEPPPLAAAAPAAGAAFGNVPVTLAPGARIEEMTAVGPRLALRIAEGESQRILVLDPATGMVAGAFLLSPAGR